MCRKGAWIEFTVKVTHRGCARSRSHGICMGKNKIFGCVINNLANMTETRFRSGKTQRYINPQRTRIKYRRFSKGFLSYLPNYFLTTANFGYAVVLCKYREVFDKILL